GQYLPLWRALNPKRKVRSPLSNIRAMPGERNPVPIPAISRRQADKKEPSLWLPTTRESAAPSPRSQIRSRRPRQRLQLTSHKYWRGCPDSHKPTILEDDSERVGAWKGRPGQTHCCPAGRKKGA